MGTLLGRLAQFGSFSGQGEVLCTQGLAYLLKEHPNARSAFADEIAARAGVSVSHDLTWLPEQRQRDGGRPDLEARIDQTPIVKVEAKLGAAFDSMQFQSYVGDLQQRLQGQRLDGIFVVLVPRARTTQATDVVKVAFGLEGPGPWRAKKEDHPDITITVVSWDDVLAVLGRVESERFGSELEQFNGMYRELVGRETLPLQDLVNWREREDYFINLVDSATRRLTSLPSVLPMGREPLEQDPKELENPEALERSYNRRYVCQLPGDPKPSCFSIGVRDPFEGSETPIWLRFHQATGGFRDIRDRIESSHLSWTSSDRHIWIPLKVLIRTDFEDVVNDLVAQANAVLQVAYQPTP
jgi:hypothetical protein